MYDELVKQLRMRANLFKQINQMENCIMDEAADAIEKLSKPKWIPVTERLPEHLTSVIVHRKDGGIFIWEYFDTSSTDECWIDDSMNVYSFYDVTHWMPLPEPPEEETC